jgi:hypothetical protein
VKFRNSKLEMLRGANLNVNDFCSSLCIEIYLYLMIINNLLFANKNLLKSEVGMFNVRLSRK